MNLRRDFEMSPFLLAEFWKFESFELVKYCLIIRLIYEDVYTYVLDIHVAIDYS